MVTDPHQEATFLLFPGAGNLASTRVVMYQLPGWKASSGTADQLLWRSTVPCHPGLPDGEVVDASLPFWEGDILEHDAHNVPASLAAPGSVANLVRQRLAH